MATLAARSDFGGANCPRCRRDLDHARLRSGRQLCPHCGRAFEALRFDPPEAAAAVSSVEQAGPEGAMACASHRGNAAVANCGRCGVFMCELCQIEADGLVLCPTCFDRLSAEGALASARTTFRDYGRMGLTYAVAGLLLWFLSLPLGLGAIYGGVQEIRQRKRIGEGSLGRAWTAIVLGTLEVVGGVFLLAVLFGSGG
jgi:hypothetical protein